jgi:hypothetical protein
VKEFLQKYCDDRRHPDPLSFFYEALFVGFEWGDVLNNDDFNNPSPPTSGYYLSALTRLHITIHLFTVANSLEVGQNFLSFHK